MSGGGLLRVVSNTQMMQKEREAAEQVAAAQAVTPEMTSLASYIRTRWTVMRNHRNSANSGPGGRPLNERLLSALRTFHGEYDARKLAEIRQFGGSEVYARIVSVKCRGASSLLRDIYLGTEKPWQLEPTPDPVIPDDVSDKIQQVVAFEIDGLMRSGQPVDPVMLQERVQKLMDDAARAMRTKAKKEAKEADRRLDDVLTQGGFYEALSQIIFDLPIFPYVVMKGPVVRMTWDLAWENGKPIQKRVPRLYWERVSPFDFYWSPGASTLMDADTAERQRNTRASLAEVMDLPGYNKEAVQAVLEAFGRGGLHDWMDSTDQPRAQSEGRENPNLNQSGLIDTLEFNGMVPGRMLQEWGMKEAAALDPLKDVQVQAWLIDRWVIKVQLTPSPRRRPYYYTTSFEKVPGTLAGNGLPDILEDIQDVANSALRALVNNQAMASGPQIEITTDRVAQGSDVTSVFPWKRWYVTSDPIAGSQNQPSIKFFQPQSHAQEFLIIYKEMTNVADELSAIPKYTTGSDRLGGAGRTASGLSMLMNNANKILQTVAANLDGDIVEQVCQNLYDMCMLVDAGVKLRGDENVRVWGVQIAAKRELERQRQLELLRLTANPIDMQAMGVVGRAKMLRTVADATGFEGEEIVPDPEQLQAAMGAAAEPGAPPQVPPGKGGGPSPQAPAGGKEGPRLNVVQPGPTGPGQAAQAGGA